MSNWENRFKEMQVDSRVTVYFLIFVAVLNGIGSWLRVSWLEAGTFWRYMWYAGVAYVAVNRAVLNIVSEAVKELQDSMEEIREAVERLENARR